MDWHNILITACLLELAFLTYVRSSGQLKIKLIDYRNPDHLLYNGECCDTPNWCSWNECDNFFKFCANAVNSGVECSLGTGTTKRLGDDSFSFPGNGGSLGGGLKNPLTYRFQDWKGATFVVEVWDDDGGMVIGKLDDFVDKYKLDISRDPARNQAASSSTKHRLCGLRSCMNVHVDVYCDNNYFVPQCSVYCIPRDTDHQGHYVCDYVNGRKVCREGWYDTLTNCTKKKKDCTPRNDTMGHFDCNPISGEKICLSGWAGPNCTEVPNTQSTIFLGPTPMVSKDVIVQTTWILHGHSALTSPPSTLLSSMLTTTSLSSPTSSSSTSPPPSSSSSSSSSSSPGSSSLSSPLSSSLFTINPAVSASRALQTSQSDVLQTARSTATKTYEGTISLESTTSGVGEIHSKSEGSGESGSETIVSTTEPPTSTPVLQNTDLLTSTHLVQNTDLLSTSEVESVAILATSVNVYSTLRTSSTTSSVLRVQLTPMSYMNLPTTTDASMTLLGHVPTATIETVSRSLTNLSTWKSSPSSTSEIHFSILSTPTEPWKDVVVIELTPAENWTTTSQEELKEVITDHVNKYCNKSPRACGMDQQTNGSILLNTTDVHITAKNSSNGRVYITISAKLPGTGVTIPSVKIPLVVIKGVISKNKELIEKTIGMKLTTKESILPTQPISEHPTGQYTSYPPITASDANHVTSSPPITVLPTTHAPAVITIFRGPLPYILGALAAIIILLVVMTIARRHLLSKNKVHSISIGPDSQTKHGRYKRFQDDHELTAIPHSARMTTHKCAER